MYRKYIHMAIVIASAILLGSTQLRAQRVISFSVFYDELSPYGVWVNDAQYGYVWVPDAGAGFQPYYTNGHWVMTEYGNTWVSGYAWGWAPFHYGRWLYDAFYGWVWVPGYDWGPAWVYWRYGAGYYGWAPLTPGFTVSVSFGVYNCPMDWWVFLPPQYLYRRSFTNYVRDRRLNLNIHNQTTVINNTYINRTRNTTYITGPSRTEYMRETGRDVREYRVKSVSTRTNTYTRNNTLRIYSPEVEHRDRVATPVNTVRSETPLRSPVPVSTNQNRPAPFATEVEKNRTSRPAPVQRTPTQRTPVQREPVQRTPTQRTPVQREPVQRTPTQRTPVQREPVQRTPTQRTPTQRTPVQREPVQRTPTQRTPTQRTPTQRSAPTQRSPQRTEPVKKTGTKREQSVSTPARNR